MSSINARYFLELLFSRQCLLSPFRAILALPVFIQISASSVCHFSVSQHYSLMMLTLFQSHSMSRLLPSTRSDYSSSTASSSSHSDDRFQPLKPIRSSSDSAKANKTVPSLFSSRRGPHRRSDITRTRSLELVNKSRYPRARSIKCNKKIVGEILGMVSLTNREIESSQQASIQRRNRVLRLAAEKGRALNDTRDLHRTIRLVVKVAVRDNYERRAATILQAIARGYLVRKLFLPKQVLLSPRRVNFHRQYSEITMSDFGGSMRSLASCSLSTDQFPIVTPAPTDTTCRLNDSFEDIPATPPFRKKFLGKNNRREHPTPPSAPIRLQSLSSIDFEDDDEDEESLCGSIPSILKPIKEGQYSSPLQRSCSLSSLFSRSTDEPSRNPNRQNKMSKGDDHPSYNCINDSVQDTPASPPFRQGSLSKNNRHESPAPPLAPVRLQSLSSINFVHDGDEDSLCIEDEESVCSSIPPPLELGRESSFSSVFGVRQGSDLPLSRPRRTMSPMVSPVGNYNDSSMSVTSRNLGSSSFLKLSASMAEF